MNRRTFLKRTTVSTASAWLGTSWMMSGCHTEEDMIGKPNWIVEGTFRNPLPLPRKAGGTTSLVAQSSSASILDTGTSQTLAYQNGVLGPLVEVHQGDAVAIDLHNNLAEPTNIHWHGLLVPADMDGHPQDLAHAGESLRYQFDIQQRAGTYWYHPHPHEATARQVYMGMAGLFLVRDEEELALGLPSGDQEIPLILQDKRFDGASLLYAPSADEIMTGYLGEKILVNGMHAPVHSVETRWYRLRVLNGSTARVYQLGFSNRQDFYVIGTDGGLLSKPEKLNALMLAPGERVDVLVDFSTHSVGSEVFLKSFKFSEFNVQGRQEFTLMKFAVREKVNASFVLPATLSMISPLVPTASTFIRTFNIASLVGGAGHGNGSKHGINGMIYENDHIAFSVNASSTEIWEFDNHTGDEIHPMHVHGVQFQILQREGGRNEVFAFEKGWKDTVMVMPKEKVSVIMKFPAFLGKFVLHCHNLEHEDDGMMLNYEIA